MPVAKRNRSVKAMKKKAVFLDRDGTINIEKNYLVRFEDWEFIDGAVEAIKGLQKLGFLVVVVTNQAGIARGFYKSSDVERLHNTVNALLKERGCCIDAFYFCPHHPDISAKCDCRKPAPGMILRAADELGIDLSHSYMVGDKIIDVLAGIHAGVCPIMVKTGYGMQEETDLKKMDIEVPVTSVDDIFAAYQFIKKEALRKQMEGD